MLTRLWHYYCLSELALVLLALGVDPFQGRLTRTYA